MSVQPLEYYFLLFFVSAVFGWCMEVVCKLIQFRRFINRGFLIGPYCPIYGVGSVLITAMLSRFAADPLAVFALAMVLCGSLEYLTSYLMEKLFHARWWDYSQRRFNLNGRVCANTLIPFGLLGLVMIYLVKPVLFGWFSHFSKAALAGLCMGIGAVMLADVVVSTTVLGKIRKTANLSDKDDTEAITKSVREQLARESVLARRILHAFPYAKLYSAQVAADLKEKREELRRNMREREMQFKREIDAKDAALKAELKKAADRRARKSPEA